MEHIEPTLLPPPVSRAAEPVPRPGFAARRGGILVRALLVAAVLAAAAGGAYFGLRRLFYREVPARPPLSIVPAGSQPLFPSLPVAPTPVPPAPTSLTPPRVAAPEPLPGSDALLAPAAPILAQDQDPPLHREFGTFLAGTGRDVTALSDAQRIALFGEFLEWRSRQNPTAMTPAVRPFPRIVIHVPLGSAAAEALSAQLLTRLGSRPGTVEARHVAETPSRPSIRYFHPEDEPVARQAAAWMADTGLNWTVRDFSSFQPRPSRGTIEVWLPRAN